MKKLLYTDKPEVRSGYDQDASKSIRFVLVFMGACFLLTVLLAAFAGIGG